MKPSPLQEAIYSFILNNEELVKVRQPRKHLLVDAKAGAGKSSTCLGIIERLRSSNVSIAYAMFNRQTVDEFKSKASRMGIANCVDINTAHSFGLQALKNCGVRARIEAGKLRDLAKQLHVPEHIYKNLPTATRLVTLAKDRGLGLRGEDVSDYSLWGSLLERHISADDIDDIEAVIELSLKLFKASLEQISVIDFSDMIYLPLYMGGKPQQYDYVLVDEAQDTNLTRRMLYQKMLKPWGSMIVVGDPYQAIYGFTGADNDSMQIFQRELSAETLPLSVCYRCDKAIIKEAQTIVPGIEYREDAGEGKISKLDYNALLAECLRLNLGPEDAILCRNNAPNVRLAFAFIRKGLPCRIEGRDIGFSIVQLVEKLKAGTLSELTERLEEYRQHEVGKAMAKQKESLVELVNDKCDTLEVLIERAMEQRLTVYDLRNLILSMFSDANDPKTPKDILTLSSVHKSKGREWERVFILGRDQFMPAKYAKQDWEQEQERNLIYVAITRAMHELVYVSNVPK